MNGEPEIEQLLQGQPRDVGGSTVARVLPSAARRAVGPFVFFDHFGPTVLAPGQGIDVRPHPHINLATVTYLFQGAMLHRDSIGSNLVIRPGGVNWMTAGRGIAHSERTPPALRQHGGTAHGLQLWVALPRADEEVEPTFAHHPAESLPQVEDGGVRVRVLAGAAFGARAPVKTLSPLFYVDASLPTGGVLPMPTGYPERAAYIVEGAVWCGSARVGAGTMIAFAPGSTPTLKADTTSRLVLIGGEPLDGPRHIWWNFVSSSKERIEQAKSDWRDGRFAKIPGDDQEFIALPENS